MIRWWLVWVLLCVAEGSPAATAQTTQHWVAAPNAAEFREGDLWSAYDPAESERLHAPVYYPLVKMNNKWEQQNLPSPDDLLARQGKVGLREFTDLAGKTPEFPADHTKLFAAPDGVVYAYDLTHARWTKISVGEGFATKNGKSVYVTERMTQPEADAMTAQIERLSAETPVAAPASRRDPWYADHTTHCPDGHTISHSDQPDDWRPQMLNMIVACAAIAKLPLPTPAPR